MSTKSQLMSLMAELTTGNAVSVGNELKEERGVQLNLWETARKPANYSLDTASLFRDLPSRPAFK